VGRNQKRKEITKKQGARNDIKKRKTLPPTPLSPYTTKHVKSENASKRWYELLGSFLMLRATGVDYIHWFVGF